jgi:hypothetical protein
MMGIHIGCAKVSWIVPRGMDLCLGILWNVEVLEELVDEEEVEEDLE